MIHALRELLEFLLLLVFISDYSGIKNSIQLKNSNINPRKFLKDAVCNFIRGFKHWRCFDDFYSLLYIMASNNVSNLFLLIGLFNRNINISLEKSLLPILSTQPM